MLYVPSKSAFTILSCYTKICHFFTSILFSQDTPSHVSSDNDRRPKTNGEETPRLAPEGNNPGNMIIDSQPSVITRINGE